MERSHALIEGTRESRAAGPEKKGGNLFCFLLLVLFCAACFETLLFVLESLVRCLLSLDASPSRPVSLCLSSTIHALARPSSKYCSRFHHGCSPGFSVDPTP